ncbi:MAG: UbiA prenyltransferase family protein [Microgenomates bacterium OLB22]|nr:MAG: UbiA prenyltransferase family protein [Microgenomates bacterium OLB22]
MKEVKYISHLTRNGMLYTLLYIMVAVAKQYHIPWNQFLIGLFGITAAYAPVYFLNDYTDKAIDKKDKRANLYNTIGHSWLYVVMALVVGMLGITLSYLASPSSISLLAALYLINALYSLRPFRFKDHLYPRIFSILFIYLVKAYYIFALLRLPRDQVPIPFIFLFASVSVLGLLLYKRRIISVPVLEHFCGGLFLVAWIITIATYPMLLLYLLPLPFFSLYIYFYYQKVQIPLSSIQLLYFLYVVTLFWIYSA